MHLRANGRPCGRRILVPLFLAALTLLPGGEHGIPESAASPAGARKDGEILTPAHRRLMTALAERPRHAGPPPALCFSGPVPEAVLEAVNAAIFEGLGEFQLTNRWTSTATNGGGLGQGQPTTITYSFAPDGTPISGGAGEPAAPSDLFAVFNAAFGSAATWQNLIHQSFQAWGALSGATYVHEPADDGIALGTSAGQLGVRGDVRIGGHYIDGGTGSNILAYNNFPNNGDMVLDTSNASYFANTSSNYRRFRNVVSHEHGHGMGLLHVCPSNQTKLMEPYISTAYDGPQHDDILAAQRHYGDDSEPNDTAAAATDLGTLGVGITSLQNLSCDDNTDVDWFRISVAANKMVSVTVAPIGSTYTQGPQTSACDTGSAFNSLTINDLAFDIRGSNGTTVLASAASQPAGSAETIANLSLGAGGVHDIRVYAGSADSIQLYSLSVTVAEYVPPTFTISWPDGVPSAIAPSTAWDVDLATTNGTGSPDPAAAFLFRSVDGAAFTAAPLADLGGGLFRATLPAAPCFSTIRWYVSIAPAGGGVAVVSPAGAPTGGTHVTRSGLLTTVFFDDFDTNLGWTVQNDAALTDGAWERGVPVGGGLRGDPPTDANGSGACWLTDNTAGNSDVDGGATMLTSPLLNLAGVADALIEVDIWYDNVFGSNPGTDTFPIQISNNNGASWVTLETYTASAGVWVHRSYRVAQFVAPTSQVRVRFTAQDPAPGAVVEAGVDRFRVYACEPDGALGACGAGTYPAGGAPSSLLTVNGSDGGSDRRVEVPVSAPLTLALAQPATSGTPSRFLLFATAGVPGPADAYPLPPLGTLCFPPCVLAPGNPALFMLADSFGTGFCGTPLLPSTPTPWSFTGPGIPMPGQFTFQAIIEETPSTLAITNAVVLHFVP